MHTEQVINSGYLHILKRRKALNKPILKVKSDRSQIESSRENLIQLVVRANDTESEEFHKNLVIDFLKKIYYEPNHFINTKGRNDRVIHNGNKDLICQTSNSDLEAESACLFSGFMV